MYCDAVRPVDYFCDGHRSTSLRLGHALGGTCYLFADTMGWADI